MRRERRPPDDVAELLVQLAVWLRRFDRAYELGDEGGMRHYGYKVGRLLDQLPRRHWPGPADLNCWYRWRAELGERAECRCPPDRPGPRCGPGACFADL